MNKPENQPKRRLKNGTKILIIGNTDFYYNKEDKRLLPPKKTGMDGWTVNFANAKSVVFFLL
jgi:uncharacterized membrane protein